MIILPRRRRLLTERERLCSLTGAALRMGAGGGGSAQTYREAVLADNPIAFYRLAEASGTTVIDASPNANDATYNGSPIFGQASLVPSSADSSVRFEGGAFIDALPGTGGVSGVTFELTFRIDASSSEQRVFDWQDSSGFFLLRDNVPNGGQIQWLAQFGGDNEVINLTVDTTTSHHYVVVAEENVGMKFYLDGALQAELTVAGTFSGQGTARRIGSSRNSSSNRVVGGLDDFALYNVTLTDSGVAAHYSAWLGA